MRGMSGLFAALGLVGIAFALFSFLIMLLSGAGLASDLGWIGTNLVVGVGLLITSAVINWGTLRERMSSGEARRAGKYGGSALVGTFVAIAILGMLGFLATRYSKRFDWSEAGLHTLSDQSQKVLTGLDGDVEVVALVSKLDERPVRELLDKYSHASPHVKVEYADPTVRPGLLEQYGITPDQLGNGLVRIAIGGEAVNVSELDENKITNALVKLTRTGQKTVYFLEGHGERAIAGEEGNQRDGYSRAAEALRNENYTVHSLLLASTGEVPADADAVILAGARRPLLDVERQALDTYLTRGGSLMLNIDPRVGGNLVEQADAWGVTLGNDVVIDSKLALFGRAMTPFAGSFDPHHEITQRLRDPAMFHEVRSTKARAGFTELVFTSDESWGETDFELLDSKGKATLNEPPDLRGPVPVAVAGHPTLPGDGVPPAEGEAAERDPRMVVVGDADFASNEFIDAYSNLDLFVNSVNWLLGDVEAISIRAPQSRASRFELTGEQFRSLRSLSLFVLPEAIAVLAVFTWWSRRHPKR